MAARLHSLDEQLLLHSHSFPFIPIPDADPDADPDAGVYAYGNINATIDDDYGAEYRLTYFGFSLFSRHFLGIFWAFSWAKINKNKQK